MISSRTPEGMLNCCPICGHALRFEPSQPFGDAPCPACGSLLWFMTTAVRVGIPILCLVLGGCAATLVGQEKLVSQEVVTDSSGTNQLALMAREVSSAAGDNAARRTLDFGSLVWRTNSGGEWRDHITITATAFQSGSPHRRWVSQLHTIDATKGTAIIKVAEGDVPDGALPVNYIYSWREWNLQNNKEVRLIRTCANPFEKL